MVSYYNSTTMYRHQQAMSTPSGPQFHHQPPMHSWYAAGYHHHQPPQMSGAPQATSYCMQEEQQMWHPHSHPHHHAVFHDFPEFPAIHPIPNQVQDNQENHHPLSPTITVSGSEMSSPGAVIEAVSPSQPPPHHNLTTRPPPARSPYEWIKKNNYQTQSTPELETGTVLLDFTDAQDFVGKTRTKDKYRVVYTDHQRVELEKEFYYSRYITIRRKSELANNLGLSERQVKIWFQNRRAKERKQVKKREEFAQKDMDLLQQQQQQQASLLQPHNQGIISSIM